MTSSKPTYRIPFELPPCTYGQALDILGATKRFGIQPMLESVEDMLEELGNPDDHFQSLQIAGTNGKTSTARYAAAILRGEGLRVALYTSPELVSLTERMEVDGRPVSGGAFAQGIAAAQEAGERVNVRRTQAGQRPYDITEFDILTVAALVVFALAGVDAAVLECGMGGRWDATSAAHNIRSVAITGIGLDHMRILGDTLEKIAAEKAAIIKRGRTCVLGVGTATPDTMEDVFLKRAAREGVTPVLLRPDRLEDAAGEMHPGIPRTHQDLPHASYRITQRPPRIGAPVELTVTTPRTSYPELAALKPSYQAANIACAVVLCELFLGRMLDADALFQSVVQCPTPGRFDLLVPDPPVLIDACHNPQSVQTFLTAVRSVTPQVQDRPALLCAVLADKDVAGIVDLLAPEFPQVFVTQTSSDRALGADQLAILFERAGKRPRAVYPSVAQAVADLGQAGVSYVACGSITTAGEVASILRPGVQNLHGDADITLGRPNPK